MQLRHLLWPSALLLLAQLPCAVYAHIESCAGACELVFGNAVFPDSNAQSGYYPLRCGSQMRASSVYLCMRVYCQPREISVGWVRLNTDCEQYGNITLPPFSVIGNYTNADISHLRRLDITDNVDDLQLDAPALPTKSLFDVAFRTKDAWNNSVQTRHIYGNVMSWFWASVIVLGVLVRFADLTLQPPFSSINEKQSEHSLHSCHRLRLTAQAYIIVPAAFSRHCSQPFGWFTVPPRLQSGLLLAFAGINLVLCCATYDVFEGNLYWTPFVQWMRYVGDRTGILAAANLPIIWLFATRNNVVLFVTGWSFDTAMQFHRWVARVSTVEALVHSVAYVLLVIQGHSWADFWNEWTLRYWNMGVLATVAMCALCAASLYPIRHYRYELFLFLHISLGILTLLGMWYHVEIFNGEYNFYLWPCIWLWLVDRLGRILRLAYLNFPFLLSFIRFDQSSNAVWLEVPCPVSHRPKPGEYYFLYLLHDRTFYQSHPFTVSSWHQAGQKSKTSLNFLIRPYDGFTRRIAELARKPCSKGANDSPAGQARMLVEGPYGTSHNLKQHELITFMVGGTGVAVALAYLNDMFEGSEQGQLVRYKARHVQIIWAIQTLAMFEHVLEQEIRPLLQRQPTTIGHSSLRLSLHIFVTRSQPIQDPEADLEVSSDALAQEMRKLPPSVEINSTVCEEDPSEQSPLLSPGESVNSTPRAQTPDNLSSMSQDYHLPDNIYLAIHANQRPDIPTAIDAICRCNGSKGDSFGLYHRMSQHGSNQERRNTLDSSQATEGEEAKTSIARPRIALISCGPASLSDEVRAAVVDTLRTNKADDLGEIDFWSESYSW